MSAPVIVAIESDPDALRRIDDTLRDRYGRDYRIECTGSTPAAGALLERLAADDADVALVLAGHWLDGATGSDVLDDRASAASRTPDAA